MLSLKTVVQTQLKVYSIDGVFVVPTGIEPVSNAPEAFVVSILLRDHEKVLQ